MTLQERSVSPQLREGTPVIASACFNASCPGDQETPQGSEPRVVKESAALCWCSAAELGWAPGMEGAQGKWAALQRDSCAQEQLLCKAQQG